MKFVELAIVIICICLFLTMIYLGVKVLFRSFITTPRVVTLLAWIILVLCQWGLYLSYPSAKSWIEQLDPDLYPVTLMAGKMVLYCSISFLLVAFLDVFLWRGLLVSKGKPIVPKILIRIINLGIYSLTVITVIVSILKINVVEIIFASGVVALILGYGAQSTLANFFSGIALNVSRNIKPGDYIEVGQYAGQIINLDWRSVMIEDDDCNMLVIPNSIFASKALTNYSEYSRYRRLKIEVKIPYSLRPAVAKTLLEKAAFSSDDVLHEPAPCANLVEYDDTGMKYILLVFTNNPKDIRLKGEVMSSIYYELLRLNIDIAPQHLYRANKSPLEHEPLIVKSELLAFLSDIGFLSGFSEDELATIQKKALIQYFGPNETIIQSGTINTMLRIIYSGQVVVLQAGEDGIENVVLAKLGMSTVIGEMGVLLGDVAKQSVNATRETIIISLPRRLFREMIDNRPELADYFYDLIMQRRASNEQRIEQHKTEEQLKAEKKSIIQNVMAILRSDSHYLDV